MTQNLDAGKPIIPVLVGPTGSGKTSIAIEILKKYPEIDIISADSRQIYKHLNIGTDKPSKTLLDEYRFHLVDFIEPGKRYTAFNFVEDSELIIKSAFKRNVTPLICGGTGLYVRALVEGIVEIPDDDLTIRNQLEEETIEKGPKYLFDKLRKIDPEEASRVHPHNIKRIIRALEIYYITGKTKSDIISQSKDITNEYDYHIVCLIPPREKLYEKINSRVDLMVSSGLIDEVEKLYGIGIKEEVEKINVIGYNELFKYFDNELTLDEAINYIKQNSRQFAKRQITWYRGMKNISFFNTGKDAFNYLLKFWTPNANK